jgi:YbbR domain-containing protein
MKKTKANKILTSRAFFIVVSILVSIFLWLYVVNVENNEIDVTVPDIPVTFIGADDILADRQLLVKDQGTQNVSLTIRCKRSQATKMKRDNFEVTVDLTDIRSTGTHDRIYDVKLPEDVSEKDTLIIGKSPEYVTVDIVKLSSKPVPVYGLLNGGAAEGYMVKQLEFSPATVMVSGPEEVIARIDRANVVIERENLNKTITEQRSFQLVDRDNQPVESAEIDTDVDMIDVTVPIVMYKDVPLSIDIIEGGGAKESNAIVEIEPAKITLAGDAELLEGLNKITLGAIDLADFESTYTGTYQIKINNDLENISKTNEATVTVNLRGLTVKHVQAKNITCINVTEGYSAEVKTLFLDVKVRGPEGVVKLVDTYSISVYADLADLGTYTGNKQVPAKVYVDGYDDVGVIGSYDVVISVEQKTGDEEG